MSSFSLFISSYKQEKDIVAYIASEIGVDVSEITVPDYICCACFNILREQFFGFYSFLFIMNRKKTPSYGCFCCGWR